MSDATSAHSPEQAGASLGSYKLLEQIGEGGMGTIWLAEQREPVKRRVALKIIKLGMDTKQVIARFEAERQALAMMDHPHIAKVFDAGATETGRPYFVMEYIKGIPILEYCDKEKVDTKARLLLFTKVCQAIQHAHQKGIIHRDIKPSNVLVTLHDGVPVPKVIDFGIAKATNSELTSKTLFTEHQQIVGTPAYMAPEQAEMSGLDIDTRSDIYSLGVLLYELLTGTTPFDMRTLLKKGFVEMMRTIREDEPQKPSTRISTLGTESSQATLQRHVDARRLSSQLRGDLDWIVMKCLEKDRSRRYETANGLAADILRHLHDEPVTAGAPSAGYKLRKYVRRHRGQVLAGSAVFAALVVGLVAFAWQARVASDERDRAVSARESEAEQRRRSQAARAKAEEQQALAKEQEAEAQKQAAEARRQEAEARTLAAIARAVAKFQTDMLAAVRPSLLPRDPATGKLLKDKVTVVQAMAAAVRVLDEGSLRRQPVVEARVRATIGSTLKALSRYDEAEPNLRKALALYRAAFPEGNSNVGACMSNLASLLQVQNKLDEAESLFREALVIARAAHPAGHPNIAVALSNLAILLQEKNELSVAEPLLHEALAIQRGAFPPGHVNIAKGMDSLAALLLAQGKLEESERLYRESLKMRRAALPALHPDIAEGLDSLAIFLVQQRRGAEAEPLLREALEILRATLPAGHSRIATSANTLAVLLEDQGKWAEAEGLLREALASFRKSYPAKHPKVAALLRNLASFLEERNELPEAEALYREALDMRRAVHSAGHLEIAEELHGLATVLRMQSKLEEAEPLYREALAIRRAAHPTGTVETAVTLNNLAALLADRNQPAEAEALYREALAMRRAVHPAGHPGIATGLNNLAAFLQREERLAEAEPLFREALEIQRASDPAERPKNAPAQSNLAVLYWRLGQFDKAIPLLEEALKMREAALGREHPETILTVTNLGANYRDAGRISEAIPLLEEAYRGRRLNPTIAKVGFELLDAYEKAVDPAKPESRTRIVSLIAELLLARRAELPENSPELATQLASFAQILLRLEAWDAAEPLVRECLAVREKVQPESWSTFNTRSMLGGILLGQGQLAEAEPLLLDGYRGMKEREASIPAPGATRIPEALERLARLYDTRGDVQEAERWRSELSAARAQQKSSTTDGGKR